jgi:hypothetical protein
VHVVFDISGVIDVEPFLIQTGFAYADLALPAGAELIAVQIPVWDGLALRGATLAAPIYAVRFDAQWVDWLYYLLLEARNNGADPFDALASDRAFGAITHDAAVREGLCRVAGDDAAAGGPALLSSGISQRELMGRNRISPALPGICDFARQFSLAVRLAVDVQFLQDTVLHARYADAHEDVALQCARAAARRRAAHLADPVCGQHCVL